ncbi:MAG: hypothetical protein JXR35_08760 [Rhodobacteraceae bacterium]|nr:hypothetical protein [Paracoccaceae bacterium]
MSEPGRTLTGRVVGGVQTILSVFGLCGVVDAVTGLGHLAIRLVANYLILSKWIMDQISALLPLSLPDYLFHYFLLGAPFWTPIFFGLRRMIGGAIPTRYAPVLVWYALRTPSSAIVAAAAAAPPGTSFANVFFERDSRKQTEALEAWRNFRHNHPWKWIKVSVAANAIRLLFITLIFLVFALFLGVPVIVVLCWPYFLYDALRARLRHWFASKGPSPQEAPITQGKADTPDPYVRLRDRALDRFALVLFLFAMFTIITLGIEQRGGLETIWDDFQKDLEQSLP